LGVRGANREERTEEGREEKRGHLDLNLGVHLAQVVQHAVQVQLARAQDNVLATLLNLSDKAE
jgi:hypothetical protein